MRRGGLRAYALLDAEVCCSSSTIRFTVRLLGLAFADESGKAKGGPGCGGCSEGAEMLRGEGRVRDRIWHRYNDSE